MTSNNEAPPTKILIVEDEVLIALDLESRLIRMGYLICGRAATGRAALAMVERDRPDLVLMDINIEGGMDGIETADDIRLKFGIPVIFLTAYDDDHRLESAKLTQPFGYLMKPFHDKDLKITIQMALYVAKVDRERRKTEEALRRSEEKYRQLYTHAPSGLYELDFDLNRIVDINDAACQYLGYTREEIFNMPPDQLLDENSRELLALRLIQLANGENVPEQDVFKVIGKDGRHFWLLLSVSLIRKEGRVKGVSVVAHDITDLKNAEEAVRQSEEKFALAFRTSPYAIAITRLEDGNLIDVNDTFISLSGYSREEVLDQSLTSLDLWYDSRDRKGMVTEIIEKGKVTGREFLFRKKTGELMTGLISAQIIHLANETCILASINDITDHKRAEAEKERLQSQLQQAQKMEAVGALAGGIAHDFNNLLQAISGYTQILLMNHDENTEDHQNLKAIQTASVRAANLVRQLLLFSRKVETERLPTNLNREIEQGIRLLERTIPKMVHIEIHPEDNLWPIKADPVQMEQVLLNLGTNAADAMPDGGRLIIETKNLILDQAHPQPDMDVDPGRYVLLSVSDTGQGMDDQTLKHIFEPFYTTKDIGKGTGLGLASVYGIIKSHGGHITCNSEIGRGTVFKIYLPAIDQEDIPGTNPAPPPKLPRGAETILLVDDEEPIRDFATQILQKYGYQTRTAASGEEALEVYRNEHETIDLVIMDINMPGMGGYKSLCEIIQFNPSVKVLVASGYSINGQAKQTLAAGAAGYIEKPYNLADLIKKIRGVLDGDH